MVRSKANFGVIEMNGVVRDPHVFAKSSRYGFLAMINKLREDIGFLWDSIDHDVSDFFLSRCSYRSPSLSSNGNVSQTRGTHM